MTSDEPAGTTVTLTDHELTLVTAALRQYEPYWPASADPADIARVLAAIHADVDAVLAKLRS